VRYVVKAAFKLNDAIVEGKTVNEETISSFFSLEDLKLFHTIMVVHNGDQSYSDDSIAFYEVLNQLQTRTVGQDPKKRMECLNSLMGYLKRYSFLVS